MRSSRRYGVVGAVLIVGLAVASHAVAVVGLTGAGPAVSGPRVGAALGELERSGAWRIPVRSPGRSVAFAPRPDLGELRSDPLDYLLEAVHRSGLERPTDSALVQGLFMPGSPLQNGYLAFARAWNPGPGANVKGQNAFALTLFRYIQHYPYASTAAYLRDLDAFSRLLATLRVLPAVRLGIVPNAGNGTASLLVPQALFEGGRFGSLGAFLDRLRAAGIEAQPALAPFSFRRFLRSSPDRSV